MDRDILLILASRVLRSMAAGALGIVTSLYLYNVIHLSLTLIGIFFGVGAFTAPALSLYFGRLGDKYGRKNMLMLATAMLPMATAILLLTRNYGLLLVAAALGGFGTAGALASGSVGAVGAPMMTAILADKTKESERTMTYSLLNVGSGLAGAVGVLMAHLGYSESFTISLILSAISLIAIAPIRDDYRPRTITKTRDERSGERDRKIMKMFAAVGMLNGTGQGLVTPFLPILFELLFHATRDVISNIFFLGGVGAALMSLATPALTQRMGFLNAIIVTRTISTAALVALPFIEYLPLGNDLIIAVMAYLIFVMFRVAALPAQQSLMMGLVSREARSTTAGVNQAARLFPSAVATTASGAMLDYLPIPVPFTLALIVNAANIYLYKKFFGSMAFDGRKISASLE